MRKLSIWSKAAIVGGFVLLAAAGAGMMAWSLSHAWRQMDQPGGPQSSGNGGASTGASTGRAGDSQTSASQATPSQTDGTDDGRQSSRPSATAQTAPQPSAIAQLPTDQAKQEFLAQNNLAESDIRQIPLTDAYEVPRKAESLKTPGGVTAHQNQAYRALLKPNDPLYPQWFTSRVALEPAWGLSTGSGDVTVAVVDTGFALGHQELADRWRVNPGESGSGRENNGVDDDHNGLVDDWRGWDFAHFDNNPAAGSTNPNGDAVSHGTAVSGILAATGNNGIGTAGVDWGARVLPLQVMNDDGLGYTSDIVAALLYARSQGAKVINLSMGGRNPDPFLQTIIDIVVSTGTVVVAASGNDGCQCMVYPAAYASTLAVGAADQNDNWAPFSSYGPQLDVIAPGNGPTRTALWASSNQDSSYSDFMSGTSMAAPLVSGLVSLYMAANPNASAADAAAAVVRGADKVPGMGGAAFTPKYGHGRVNAYATTRLATLTHPDGTLILNRNTGGVYLVESGAKRPIPNPSVFLSHYYDVGQQAKPATVADLALPDGPSVNFRSGTLAKGGGPGIYALSYNGAALQKQYIPSFADFSRLGYQDREWVTVSDGFLAGLPDGPALTAAGRHPDGTLVRPNGQSDIFLLQDGQRRWVPSPSILRSISKGKIAIRPATAADMALPRAPHAQNVPFEEGAIISGSGTPLYVVDHDAGAVHKRHIVSSLIYNLLDFTGQDRLQAATAELPGPDGEPVR